MSAIHELVEVSRFYGEDSAYVIAGGGNTSFKDNERIWIKASGIPLAGISEDGFVCLSREKLGEIEVKDYSEDPVLREEEVKKDMHGAIISPENLRPSVETSLHNLMDFTYVVHTHPTVVNGLMCSNHVEQELEERFGSDALYVEYTDPGFVLFKKLQNRIKAYKEQYGKSPSIIFLQNHGVFVGADSVEEIGLLYTSIMQGISAGRDMKLPTGKVGEYSSETTKILQDHFASKGLVSRSVRSELVDYFSENPRKYELISRPFSPDIIVYCKSNYLFIGEDMGTEQVISSCQQFEETHGYYPKVIIEEKGGFIAVEESERSLENVLDIFMDQMKISKLSENFGGPHFMSPEQIHFIDNWEVENYRRKVAKKS